MDILSHGLWGVVAGKAVARRTGRKASGRTWFWWGIFPDLFAFGVPISWFLGSVLIGRISLSDFPHPSRYGEPPDLVRYPIFRLAPELYQLSHSLFVFAAVLALTYLIWRRNREILWRHWMPMFAWLVHILMDVPTHSYRFYPTPVFFPLSDWKFDGIAWSVPWFMVLNYSSLAVAFWALRKRRLASAESKL